MISGSFDKLTQTLREFQLNYSATRKFEWLQWTEWAKSQPQNDDVNDWIKRNDSTYITPILDVFEKNPDDSWEGRFLGKEYAPTDTELKPILNYINSEAVVSWQPRKKKRT